jgi:hypothetical protein
MSAGRGTAIVGRRDICVEGVGGFTRILRGEPSRAVLTAEAMQVATAAVLVPRP